MAADEMLIRRDELGEIVRRDAGAEKAAGLRGQRPALHGGLSRFD
jgi:hypothetical protein